MSTLRRHGKGRKGKSCHRIVVQLSCTIATLLPSQFASYYYFIVYTIFTVYQHNTFNNTIIDLDRFTPSYIIHLDRIHSPRLKLQCVQTKRFTHHHHPAAKPSSQEPQTIGHPYIPTSTTLHMRCTTCETLSPTAFFVRGALYLASAIRDSPRKNRSSESRFTDSFEGLQSCMACIVHDGRPFPRLRSSVFELLVPA